MLRELHKSASILLAVLLLSTQVGFLLLHEHSAYAEKAQQETLSTDHEDGISQQCSLCERFFSQTALVLQVDIQEYLLPHAQFELRDETRDSQVRIAYAPSRAPPVLG